MALYPKITDCIICFIIYNFLLIKLNEIQIQKIILTKYKKTLSYDTIRSVLFDIRQIIDNSIKLIYIRERLGGPPEKIKKVIINGWNFITDQKNNQICIFGCIEPDFIKAKFDIINVRNSNNLKKNLLNHVEAGTFVIADGWRAYNFFDGNESYWEHESHNHGRGNFGFGSQSTSHIKGTWSHLKNEIRSLYNIIDYPSQIMNIFQKYLRIVYEKNKYDFFKEEYSLDLNNYY